MPGCVELVGVSIRTLSALRSTRALELEGQEPNQPLSSPKPSLIAMMMRLDILDSSEMKITVTNSG